MHASIDESGNPNQIEVRSAVCSSAYREPSYGHGILNFINGTHAQWFWNRNQVNTAPPECLLVQHILCTACDCNQGFA